VTQHRRDRLQGHPSIDGLSRERVTKLVRVDVADPGGLGDASEHARVHVAVEAFAVDPHASNVAACR
jgi:hypothetical protein